METRDSLVYTDRFFVKQEMLVSDNAVKEWQRQHGAQLPRRHKREAITLHTLIPPMLLSQTEGPLFCVLFDNMTACYGALPQRYQQILEAGKVGAASHRLARAMSHIREGRRDVFAIIAWKSENRLWVWSEPNLMTWALDGVGLSDYYEVKITN